MLLGGALGGLMGTRWHRRVDRALMDVVPVGSSMGSSSSSAPTMVEEHDGHSGLDPRDSSTVETSTMMPPASDSQPRIRSLDEPLMDDDRDRDRTRLIDRRSERDSTID